MKTPQHILDNLKFGLEVLKAVPAERINLDAFRTVDECGTFFCSCGWFAQIPYFKSKGLSMERGIVHIDGMSVMQEPMRLNRIFGANAFSYLFDKYGCGTDDYELRHTRRHATPQEHKDLAVKRFEFRIDEIERNTSGES